ncbi:MAG: adenylyltransferase/cytidyltransferase family protein [Candidatus Terrybacteria bacterium]|nr:adenylyltransferase/cytidyltransferase family protein [Candidatus Terrybacteria bacterium]
MDIFENKNGSKKIIIDLEKLTRITDALRESAGLKIVVTIGTWDMLHIGHLRYLLKAKSYGDILVVGVDSDRAVKLYKGIYRPIVPEEERMEMLVYQTCIDFITLVDDVDKETGWQYSVIKAIGPDVFIAVEDSYPESQKTEIKKYCRELVVLPRQAENTSTSNFIQTAIKGHLAEILKVIESGKVRV